MSSYDRTNPPPPFESTHSKYSISSKIQNCPLSTFFLKMLAIVELSKIETQLMCRFQLIIVWPIF